MEKKNEIKNNFILIIILIVRVLILLYLYRIQATTHYMIIFSVMMVYDFIQGIHNIHKIYIGLYAVMYITLLLYSYYI